MKNYIIANQGIQFIYRIDHSSQKSGHNTVPKQTIMPGDKVTVATFWSIAVHTDFPDFHTFNNWVAARESVCVCVRVSKNQDERVSVAAGKRGVSTGSCSLNAALVRQSICQSAPAELSKRPCHFQPLQGNLTSTSRAESKYLDSKKHKDQHGPHGG